MLKRPYDHDGEHGSASDPKKPRNDSGASLSLAAKIQEAKKKAALLRQNKGGLPNHSSSDAASPAPSTPGNDSLAAIRARVAALKSATISHPVQPADSEGSLQTPRAALQISPDGVLKSDTQPPEAANTLVPVRRSEQKSSGEQNRYYNPDDPEVTRTNTRVSRTLLFNQHGKYLDAASKIRSQARLEQLKATIAKQARLAGLDQLSERNFMIPTFEGGVEWWDEGLLEEKTYDCIEDPSKVKIDGDDSIITSYVQHPPTLPAAQDRRLVEVKPMYETFVYTFNHKSYAKLIRYLTPSETKKIRRLRRAAELKEIQAKIRLGLQEAPQDRLRRSNMMRIMGETAVAEPSRVEMLVEAQIQERHNKHLEENETRKLTKDERREKLLKNQQVDAKKALYMCVFKIDTLASGKHRYQIDHNAKQHALTGLTIFNPRMNLVIVEGGEHSVNKFSRLMQNRIKWSEASMPSEAQQEKQERDPQWLKSLHESGELKDLSTNSCTLVFRGEVMKPTFKRWLARVCETDGEALECLKRSKLESLWSLALGSD